MKNEKNEIDPEVKKAIWKIIVYAVSVFAALFAGNISARNGYRFIKKSPVPVEIKENVKSSKLNQSCIANPVTIEYSPKSVIL